MELTPFPPIIPASGRSRSNVEKNPPAHQIKEGQQENQNSSRNVISADDTISRLDRQNDDFLPNRIEQTPFSEKIRRETSNNEVGNRVFKDITGDIELRESVIDQKTNPATQAFLDIADQDSDFRLIDTYV